MVGVVRHPQRQPVAPPDPLAPKPGRDAAALLGQLGGGRFGTVIESDPGARPSEQLDEVVHVGQCRTPDRAP